MSTTLEELEELLRTEVRKEQGHLSTVAADAGVDYQSLYGFRNGRTLISKKYLERLATYYGWEIIVNKRAA